MPGAINCSTSNCIGHGRMTALKAQYQFLCADTSTIYMVQTDSRLHLDSGSEALEQIYLSQVKKNVGRSVIHKAEQCNSLLERRLSLQKV